MFVCMDSTAKYLGTVMPIPQACGIGITVPRYFAVESIQTNIKKPPAANKITLNKDL